MVLSSSWIARVHRRLPERAGTRSGARRRENRRFQDLAEGAGYPIRNFNQRGSAGVVSYAPAAGVPATSGVYTQAPGAHPGIVEFNVSFPECSRKRKEKRSYLEKVGGDDGVRTRRTGRQRVATRGNCLNIRWRAWLLWQP